MTKAEYKALLTLMLLDRNIPELYQWIAMDGDGEVVGYTDKPIHETSEAMWYCETPSGKALDDMYDHFGTLDIDDNNHIYIGIIDNEDIDWTTTLISIKELLDE